MRQVAPHGTVNPTPTPTPPPRLSFRACFRVLPRPLSYLPYRSFCPAISRPHATLVTNLNCSTSKVNVLILPAGHRECRQAAPAGLSAAPRATALWKPGELFSDFVRRAGIFRIFVRVQALAAPVSASYNLRGADAYADISCLPRIVRR